MVHLVLQCKFLAFSPLKKYVSCLSEFFFMDPCTAVMSTKKEKKGKCEGYTAKKESSIYCYSNQQFRELGSMSLNYLQHRAKILNFFSLDISSHRSGDFLLKNITELLQMNTLLNVFKGFLNFNRTLLRKQKQL